MPTATRLFVITLTIFIGSVGCGTKTAQQQNHAFFTSGSREADQRASQRMAKAEQMSGSGQGGSEDESKESKPSNGQPAQAEGKQTLYERLGGEKGLVAIVEDFAPRAMQDPRVNWDREGVKRGTLFHRAPKQTWTPTTANIATMKQHMIQFLELATGGPVNYQGKEISAVHTDMHISNPEFDAAVGDLKASLDKLKIANPEQKELLAIIESTRPQIVTVR